MFHVKRSEMVNRIVSRETMARLTIFSDLLLQWNRTINLISRRDEPNIWERHIQDALGLAPLIPPTIAHAIDLGSGPAFRVWYWQLLLAFGLIWWNPTSAKLPFCSRAVVESNVPWQMV